MTLKNIKTCLENSQVRDKFAVFKATILDNPYIPHRPTDKQALFLLNATPPMEFNEAGSVEGFYGGAARGGKSDTLLMAALQYVESPEYSSMVLRRTYSDLALPKALMSRAQEWLGSTDAHWVDKRKTWEFPSGATLTFGFLDSKNDKYRYQGSELCCICFDELSQFKEDDYTYLSSRLCRPEGSEIPLRLLSASNPGGTGHSWVKARFIEPTEAQMKKEGKFFVPAFLEDNPFVDKRAYEESLARLDCVTREQLRAGNWDIGVAGGMFDRAWFTLTNTDLPPGLRKVRFWDCAATEQSDTSPDPDWTAGALLAYHSNLNLYYLIDMVRVRKRPSGVEATILQTAASDGPTVKIRMEKEGGSAGKIVIDSYKKLLAGYNFDGVSPTGSKVVRAQGASASCERGEVRLVVGPWISDFLTEIESFPSKGVHDDQLDAFVGAFNELSPNRVSSVSEAVTMPVRPVMPAPIGGKWSGNRIPRM